MLPQCMLKNLDINDYCELSEARDIVAHIKTGQVFGNEPILFKSALHRKMVQV